MKYQLRNFTEFLRTPFPYLFLALCIFLATTLLGNAGFVRALDGNDSRLKSEDRYELCIVCSGPGSRDALSDIGFTVANFVLFPVTATSTAAILAARWVEPVNRTFVLSVYLMITLVYGILLPFGIFSAYAALDSRMARTASGGSLFTG